ncbi:hypothetical protein [Streptomyces sp. NBC_00356]|uniref:hypothetical protein n=1 Tax=Streptomyces sp. NBC_00356 TaxID=2975724 RepID=UPI002E2563BA
MSWISTETSGFSRSKARMTCRMPGTWAGSHMPYESAVRPVRVAAVESPPLALQPAANGAAARAPARRLLLRMRASGR